MSRRAGLFTLFIIFNNTAWFFCGENAASNLREWSVLLLLAAALIMTGAVAFMGPREKPQ